MKTQESGLELPRRARPTGIESVTFHDGMLVSADDLEAAEHYPVSLLQSVLRAYFGCGVVCGLGLRVKRTLKGEPAWVLCVDRGLAVDCEGYPVELVGPVELDLSPEDCACEPPPSAVLVAVRRTTSDEAAHHGCSCGDDGPHLDCRRLRDHALVRAFTPAEIDALPGTVCRHQPADRKDQKDQVDQKGQADQKGHADQKEQTHQEEQRTEGRKGGGDVDETDEPPTWCTVMTECPSCSCDGVWVLLGSVTLDEHKGIVGEPDTSGRRWVKPVDVLCAVEQVTDGLADKIAALERTVAQLSKAPTARKTSAS